MQAAKHLLRGLNGQYLIKVVNRIVREIESWDFDAIAVCGTSGLLVGPSVAMMMDKEIIVVRKKEDKAHSCFRVENKYAGRFIFLDDLIDSGNTLNHVINAIPRDLWAGIVLYN